MVLIDSGVVDIRFPYYIGVDTLLIHTLSFDNIMHENQTKKHPEESTRRFRASR